MLQKSQDLAAIRQSVEQHLRYTFGQQPSQASIDSQLGSVALAIRQRLTDIHFATEERYKKEKVKRLYYLSMEFLIGQSLANNLINLKQHDIFRDCLREMDIELDELCAEDPDAALGNGGLGRLAACFLDSLASLGMPGYGYGINYEYGLFQQKILNGYQCERPDHWLASQSPWQIERPELACLIPVYGHVETMQDKQGNSHSLWLGWQLIIGIPHDMLIAGYGGETVNYLRLYSARSSDDFDIDIFNSGDYIKAVEQKILSESVSKVLYPSDAVKSGRELRLIQEYFLVACAIRDILRQFQRNEFPLNRLPEKVAIQLNDTHPALAVAELMRTLLDEYHLPWNEAWDLTRNTLAYTNHTLLPEALEKWEVPLFEKVLPRHLQIIYDINHRFLQELEVAYPGDKRRLQRMSIIEESQPQQIRMAYLSIVGSHSVNGVAALHSQLVKKTLVPDFYQLWPQKFNNKTNGITQRRWLLNANPKLAELISETLGNDQWITHLDQLKQLETKADDAAFAERFMNIKQENKIALAALVKDKVATTIDPDSLFDIQIKRIHEYKRQLLNALHIMSLYLRICDEGFQPATKQTFIFAGKAAPGYWEAKQIIKLIHNIAATINANKKARKWIKVVFLPDYRVSLAEKLFPAADLSEQISTAGMEASGTGNMKFALNGALTIGTLDGANVEIREEVGEDNIFIFGLRAEEVAAYQKHGNYDPAGIYHQNHMVRSVIDALRSNRFSSDEPGLFEWISNKLLNPGDQYFHLADLPGYATCQEQATRTYLQKEKWAKMAILNTARCGKFSSDRTIRQYAEDIWNIRPVLPVGNGK